jgi:hypothetical protein
MVDVSRLTCINTAKHSSAHPAHKTHVLSLDGDSFGVDGVEISHYNNILVKLREIIGNMRLNRTYPQTRLQGRPLRPPAVPLGHQIGTEVPSLSRERSHGRGA